LYQPQWFNLLGIGGFRRIHVVNFAFEGWGWVWPVNRSNVKSKWYCQEKSYWQEKISVDFSGRYWLVQIKAHSKLKLVCPQMAFTAVITEHGVSLNDASVTLMLVRRFESRDSRDSDSQIIWKVTKGSHAWS